MNMNTNNTEIIQKKKKKKKIIPIQENKPINTTNQQINKPINQNFDYFICASHALRSCFFCGVNNFEDGMWLAWS